MIIYSTRLWLKCGFDTAWDITSQWVAHKFKQDADSMDFGGDNQYRNGRILADWLVTNNPPLSLAACRVTHPDSTIEGRTWITDLGVRDSEHKHGLVECSVTLRIMDNSTMVASRPETTRPLVVKHWLERGDPAEITPGWRINMLNADNAKSFLDWIEAKQRTHPVLLLSPQMNGAMIVQPDDAWNILAGLADVVRIQHGHAEQVKHIISERYAASNGAGRIIYPAVYREKQRFIPVERLTPDDLMLMAAQEEEKHGRDLLELISHRVNSANSWSQLALEGVRELRVRLQIRQQKEHTETAEILLEEAQQKELQYQRLVSELAERDQLIGELTQQIKRTREEADQLRVSMDYSRASNNQVDGRLMELRPYFVNAVEDDALLEEVLRLIEAFFPDRVVILDSAYKSARAAAAFEHHETAFKLVLKLVTGYWDALMQGGGDARAREVFGKDEYSAQEGEVTAHNRRARDARTFTYKGQSVVMLRHLKHGVKDSIQDTLRVHFHWDNQDKKIIIGHCGKHLPLV